MRTIVALLLVAVLLVSGVPAQERGQTVTISVRDFGKGMTPVVTPYANNPEAIVYSLNMYSTQFGTRHLRFGYQPLTTYAGRDRSDTTAWHEGVTRLTLFTPAHDSAALIYAAGGRWYQVKIGIYDYGRQRDVWGSGPASWEVADDTSVLIRPFVTLAPSSDSMTTVGASMKADFDSRFIPNLQVGDSVFIDTSGGGDTGRYVIQHIHSDDSLTLAPTIGSDATRACDDLAFQRYYAPDSTRPYMRQAGDYLYTGSIETPPQTVFSRDSADAREQMYIRPLGIADSMFIDTGYYDYVDSVRGHGIDTAYAFGDTTINVVRFFQIVDRSKTWGLDYWASSAGGDATSYFVRMAHNDTAAGERTEIRTYRIVGNTDSSLILAVNFLDTTNTDTCLCDYPDWPNATDDQMNIADYKDTRAYIFSAVGALRTVVDNDDTDSLLILNGGAYMFWPNDSTFAQEDTLNYGMYWVHVLEDINLPEAGQVTQRIVQQVWGPSDPRPDPPTLYSGESVTSSFECVSEPGSQGNVCDRYPVGFHVIMWHIKSTAAFSPHRVLSEQFFKITRMDDDAYGGDTLLVHTDGPYRVTGKYQQAADSVWVTEWEILESTMPRFAGMSEFDDRLVGYGDTLQPSRINMSRRFIHSDWSQVDEDGTALEFTVFPNPTDPIVAVVPYDDRMVIFRYHDMLDYPGFGELSLSDGLVGSRAVLGLNKFLYWLDVDGVKQMERRDFNGYSIRKISGAIDPILNAWHTNTFGAAVVPIKINPEMRHLSVLVHNQRDNHLYLFFPEGSASANTHCLTYDLAREQWDGVFDISAGDAIWATFEDTSRILIGNLDSAWVTKLDYSWQDAGGGGINSELRSGFFWIEGANGWPLESRLEKTHFLARGVNGGFDSAYLEIIGETTTSQYSFASSFPSSFGPQGTPMTFWSTGNISTFWQWKIRTFGDSSASMFQPYKLDMNFITFGEDD